MNSKARIAANRSGVGRVVSDANASASSVVGKKGRRHTTPLLKYWPKASAAAICSSTTPVVMAVLCEADSV